MWEYVKQSASPSIRNRIDELEATQRLVIFFDGMDEMSRERYSEHTEALSKFAGGTMAKTLFSCRITDFSPAFIHQRLVLLPFNKNQVAEYLDKYITYFPIKIDGQYWKRSELAKYIIRGELPIEANNPFVLWLLCLYLQLKKTWPVSRVEMLRFYNEQNYQRKNIERPEDDPPFPDMNCAFLEWARFAYAITECNRGPAIPVHLLEEGNDAEKIHEIILTGKKCGVLTESRDKYKEHLVRFEHHRFQEFFAALYIHENKPEIDWINKLDAPRWQETMLNLILLGEADNVVHTFATTIEEQTDICQSEIAEIERRIEEYKRLKEEEEKKKEEKSDDESQSNQDEEELEGYLWDMIRTYFNDKSQPDHDEKKKKKEEIKEPELILSYEHESVLADRVELSSHILHQIGSGFQKVRDTIMPIFKKAVGLLADYGNPITQVKMMRACQNVKDINFIEALQKPLNSTIHWVRNQALILIGSSQAGARAVGADLPTEIGLDLANGVFPVRLSAYWKAVRSAGNRGYWWSLLIGASCYLVNVLLLLAASGMLYLGMWSLGNKPKVIGLPDFSILSQPVSIGIFAFLVLLAAGITLRIRPSMLWIGILGSVFLIGPFLPVIYDLWIGNWKGLEILVIVYSCLGFMAIFFVCTLIAVPIHFSLLTLYLAITERLRKGRHSFQTFFIGMLRNCKFDNGLIVGLLGTIGYVLSWLVGPWAQKFAQKFSDDPIHPLFAGLISLGTALSFVALIILMIFGIIEFFTFCKEKKGFVWSIIRLWVMEKKGFVWSIIRLRVMKLLKFYNKKEFVWSLKKSLLVILGLTVLVSANLLLYNFFYMSLNPWGLGTITIFVTVFLGLLIYTLINKGLTHMLKFTVIGLCLIIVIEFLVIICFFLGILLNNFLHLVISPWWTGSIAIICMTIAGALIYGWVKKGFIFFLKSAVVTLLVQIGISSIVALFISPRILVVFIGLVLVLVLAFYLRPVWYAIKRLRFFNLQKLHPGSFTKGSWKNHIEKSDTLKQKYLLLQTGHQYLSLTAAEFLDVLKEIRPLIKGEPALSTYWEKRDQLEEALRQERQG